MPNFTPILSLSLALLASASPLLSSEACITTQCDAKDFCSQVKSTISLPSQYVCGDSRLGPLILQKDKTGMKGELGNILDNYDPFSKTCPGAFLHEYGNGKGWYKYPPKDGFQLNPEGEPIKTNFTFTPGERLDRFGHENGTFLAQYGLPYEQRSLVPGNLATDPKRTDGTLYNYHVYEVVKSFTVEAGPIAPYYGQPGNGTQYHLPMPIWQAVKDGFLVEVCKPATHACGNRPGTNMQTWIICNANSRWEVGGECAASEHCKLDPATNVPFCQAERI